MTPSTPAPETGGLGRALDRAVDWLDRKGRGAWIAAMVLGFVFFWPLGLAVLLFMTFTNRWSRSMFSSSCHHGRHGHRAHWGQFGAQRSSGNTAFDAYKSETLRRLEEEQRAFEAFLDRLRRAKDQSEFDNFMTERARSAPEPAEAIPAPPAGGGAAGPVPQSY
ncbi:MAG: DUF2852 domain-containing protein [Paracoccaceae bacterium]